MAFNRIVIGCERTNCLHHTFIFHFLILRCWFLEKTDFRFSYFEKLNFVKKGEL